MELTELLDNDAERLGLRMHEILPAAPSFHLLLQAPDTQADGLQNRRA
jgi:hypothetical protein